MATRPSTNQNHRHFAHLPEDILVAVNEVVFKPSMALAEKILAAQSSDEKKGWLSAISSALSTRHKNKQAEQARSSIGERLERVLGMVSRRRLTINQEHEMPLIANFADPIFSEPVRTKTAQAIGLDLAHESHQRLMSELATEFYTWTSEHPDKRALLCLRMKDDGSLIVDRRLVQQP